MSNTFAVGDVVSIQDVPHLVLRDKTGEFTFCEIEDGYPGALIQSLARTLQYLDVTLQIVAENHAVQQKVKRVSNRKHNAYNDYLGKVLRELAVTDPQSTRKWRMNEAIRRYQADADAIRSAFRKEHGEKFKSTRLENGERC